MSSVRRMKPANRNKNWIGAWVEDGLEQEIFSQVFLMLAILSNLIIICSFFS
jgi:hypothetical protein